LCLPKPPGAQTSQSEKTKAPSLLICYITDRKQFAGSEEDQRRQLLGKVSECATAGVDFIQLREKDLSPRELEKLALRVMAALPPDCGARLLINSRIDVALACEAHGVHLPTNDLNAGEARALWGRASRSACVIGVSAHSVEEIALAESHGADFAVFAPVFEKAGAINPDGLEQLQQVCRRSSTAVPAMPVLALGGVTVQNAQRCVAAGAAGVAGIRLFQDMNARMVVAALRAQFAELAR
jgi:thiamine-phosphate pyrophosphorylase